MTISDINWTVITGSTGGIGSEIVKILARRETDMILLNRSKAKTEAQRREILAEYPSLRVEPVILDLMDIQQISEATTKINSLPGKIDALYNNSGVLTGEKILSAQGIESQFAVNALAPYLLIQNLMEKMHRPDNQVPAMIVNFSSSAISSLKELKLDNLVNPEKVGGLLSTYAQTKLALTAIAPALADSLKSKNILIRSVDPGATKSAMTTGGNSGMPLLLSWVAPFFFSSAEKQAAKVVDSADPSAFAGQSGIYVSNKKIKNLPKPAANKKTQSELIILLDSLVV